MCGVPTLRSREARSVVGEVRFGDVTRHAHDALQLTRPRADLTRHDESSGPTELLPRTLGRTGCLTPAPVRTPGPDAPPDGCFSSLAKYRARGCMDAHRSGPPMPVRCGSGWPREQEIDMTNSTVGAPSARPEQSSLVTAGASEPFRLRKVLVGVDGTATGRDAIALGDVLYEPSGQLTLAHVVLRSTPTYQNFHATRAWSESRKMLERERQAAGVAADLTGMASSSVGSGLHQLTKDCGADLLVVGSCSRGLTGRVLVGDDTRASLNGASCAVAIAPARIRRRSAGHPHDRCCLQRHPRGRGRPRHRPQLGRRAPRHRACADRCQPLVRSSPLGSVRRRFGRDDRPAPARCEGSAPIARERRRSGRGWSSRRRADRL